MRNVDGFLLPPIETWADWTSVFSDVSVWTPMIDLICAREGIEYRSIEIPRSNTNAVFILDRRAVVKIYSPFWREFDFERRLIEVLENGGDVPVPTASGSRYASATERIGTISSSNSVRVARSGLSYRSHALLT